MKEIITHAPLQTRSEDLDKHERLLSLLTAESANRFIDVLDDSKQIRLDIWNTYNKRQDEEYGDDVERNTEIKKIIDSRYKILEANYNILKIDRNVLRDDKEDYINIVKESIKSLISDKTFYVAKERFHNCDNCGYIIAPISASITACPECSGKTLGQTEKTGMFLNYNPDIVKLFESKDFDVISKEGRARVKSAMLNMPVSIQVSKHRDFGVKLDEFGVSEEFVLDPKVSIALSGKVVREMGLGEITLMVQGIKSLKNNVPFTLLLDKETKTKFLNIGLVPSYSTGELEKYGSLFYFPFLALTAAAKNGELNKREVDAYYKSFLKTKKKFDSCCTGLRNLSVSLVGKNELTALQMVNDFEEKLLTLLRDGKLKQVVEAMRSFLFNEISRVYINECKSKSLSPDPIILTLLEDVMSTMYRE